MVPDLNVIISYKHQKCNFWAIHMGNLATILSLLMCVKSEYT